MVNNVRLDPLNMFKQEKVFQEQDNWIPITAFNDYNLNWLQKKSAFSALKNSAYLTELYNAVLKCPILSARILEIKTLKFGFYIERR